MPIVEKGLRDDLNAVNHRSAENCGTLERVPERLSTLWHACSIKKMQENKRAQSTDIWQMSV
jgi:hypothetical protein